MDRISQLQYKAVANYYSNKLKCGNRFPTVKGGIMATPRKKHFFFNETYRIFIENILGKTA